MLREFNDVIPNGAERVMALCEKQSDHRQGLEKIVITSRANGMKRGQIMAFIVAIFALSVAAYCAKINQPIIGSVIAGVDIAGMVIAFMYGSHIQRKELKERREEEKKSA